MWSKKEMVSDKAVFVPKRDVKLEPTNRLERRSRTYSDRVQRQELDAGGRSVELAGTAEVERASTNHLTLDEQRRHVVERRSVRADDTDGATQQLVAPAERRPHRRRQPLRPQLRRRHGISTGISTFTAAAILPVTVVRLVRHVRSRQAITA